MSESNDEIRHKMKTLGSNIKNWSKEYTLAYVLMAERAPLMGVVQYDKA